jgi:galactonate dehydratase
MRSSTNNKSDHSVKRRTFIKTSTAAAAAVLSTSHLVQAAPKLRVTGFELVPVRATSRTVWLIVRLRTDAGITGLGEASDAFGFANTTAQDATKMQSELRGFFDMVNGQSPLDIGAYRARGGPIAAKGGLVSATAFSAIEQALWDLAGQALDVPTNALFGGKLRDALPAYANINRATTTRTPSGFAATAKATVAEGFRAVKGAPWDGFPPPGSSPSQIEAAVENGIACVVAMRDAVGPDVDVMVDCHSFFDVALAERVAKRLEPQKLTWYEEPIAPEKRRDSRNPAAHPAADGGRRDSVWCGGFRTAQPQQDRQRHHARRQTLRRSARTDAHRRRSGAGRCGCRAPQPEWTHFHRCQRSGLCGTEEFPSARVPVG